MKLKEKDALLVTGPAHYEKALVDSVLKGNKYKLNNGMTIDNNLNIISIVTSKFKVELIQVDELMSIQKFIYHASSKTFTFIDIQHFQTILRTDL